MHRRLGRPVTKLGHAGGRELTRPRVKDASGLGRDIGGLTYDLGTGASRRRTRGVTDRGGRETIKIHMLYVRSG